MKYLHLNSLFFLLKFLKQNIMKQKIKLLLLLLSFSFILSTTSCQVEEDIINSEVPQQKLILKKLSKKEFENNKLIKEKLNSFKSSENLNGRIVYDSILNFYVNTDNVIFADNGTIQTYTFPITRFNRSFVSENLIIQINGQQINTFIFDYQGDINNLKNLSQEQMQQKEILKYRILDSNISNNILSRDEYEPVEEMIICFDTFVWELVEYHEGDLTGGPLYEYGWVYQGTHCDYASNQAGGGGSSSSGGGGFGTSGGGGSSSSTDNTIITVPSTISGVDNECISPRGDLDNNCVIDENEANFVTFLDGLTTQERQLIVGNNTTKMNVFNYLVNQNWSNESVDLIHLYLNNNISGLPIVLGPDIKIDNINTFLNCLNTSQPAVLTVYCMQPVANSPVANDHTFVGHTFISITQGTHKKVIGFYPVSNYIMPGNETGQGVLGNDTNQPYNVRVTTTISSTQLQSIKNYIINHAHSTYNLDTYNCTDFAIEVGNLGGLSLPDSYGTWTGGGGSNPGALGQHIRGMSGPGITINSALGSNYFNAPTSTNCN